STSFPTLRRAKEVVGVNFQLPNIRDLRTIKIPPETVRSTLNLAKRSLHVADKNLTSEHKVLAFKPCNLKDKKIFVLIIERCDTEYIVLVVGMSPGIFQITPSTISKHLPPGFIQSLFFFELIISIVSWKKEKEINQKQPLWLFLIC
ncbi:unnamed protein product, partial [marine sediment metagenome]